MNLFKVILPVWLTVFSTLLAHGGGYTAFVAACGLLAAVAMLAVFGYFTVSSFVRARRRERRR